jgi:hypothetical protein
MSLSMKRQAIIEIGDWNLRLTVSSDHADDLLLELIYRTNTRDEPAHSVTISASELREHLDELQGTLHPKA